MKPTFRSSSMDRILSCNGSITIEPLVEKREGAESHEGSALHYFIAARLIKEFGATPPEGGLPKPDVPAGYILPLNALWIVDWAIRHIQETIPADWSLMVEVEMDYEFGRWINKGHADLIAFSPDGTESIGMDYKTGRDPVDPADSNEQVFSYLCLKKLNWDCLRKSSFQIVQPRADEESGFPRVSTVTLEGDRLIAAADTLDARVCAAMDNAMELNSGRKQCAWCSVGAQCFALQADLQDMKIRMTPEMVANIKKTPDDALLGDWVTTMKTLERPTKDAVEMLHARLDKAEEIVAGNGTRITRKLQGGSYEVKDPVKFFAETKALVGTDERMARSFKPSMTRVQDEIAEAMNVPKTGKAPVTAASLFDHRLRPLTEQGQKRILVFT